MILWIAQSDCLVRKNQISTKITIFQGVNIELVKLVSVFKIFFIFMLYQKNSNIISDLQYVQRHWIWNVPDGGHIVHVFVIVYFNLAVIIAQDDKFFLVFFVVNVLYKGWNAEIGVQIQRILRPCFINVTEFVCDDDFSLSVKSDSFDFFREVGLESWRGGWCEAVFNVVILDGFAVNEGKLMMGLGKVFGSDFEEEWQFIGGRFVLEEAFRGKNEELSFGLDHDLDVL